MMQKLNLIEGYRIDVRCAVCGDEGKPEVRALRNFDNDLTLAVRCHGALDRIRLPVDLLQGRRAAGVLNAFLDVPMQGRMFSDGVGGASLSGMCSCGTPGCHVKMRAPGCPRYREVPRPA